MNRRLMRMTVRIRQAPIRLAGIFLLFTGFVNLGLAPPAEAQSQTVALQLSGEGASNWSLSDTSPGTSGTKNVSLRNNGSQDGRLLIWLSDVVNSEGLNPESETGDTSEPGELGDFLTLTPSCSGLESNLSFPIPVNQFPGRLDSSSYVDINRISAGQTVTLVWNWRLPPEADNRVQGDSVTFTINYYLEEIIRNEPPAGGGGGGGGLALPPTTTTLLKPEKTPEPPKPTQTTVPVYSQVVKTIAIKVEAAAATAETKPKEETRMGVTEGGSLDKSYTVPLLENKVAISFESGTQIITTNDEVPEKIVVKEVEPTTFAPPPKGLVLVSPVYTLQGYLADGTAKSVKFDPPIRLSLSYEMGNLPVEVSYIFVAYYDEKLGWVQLESPEGFVAAAGQAVGQVSHLTPFAVLAEFNVPEPTPIPKPPVIEPPPVAARFELSQLETTPKVNVGETVVISIAVANTGGLSGEFTLKVNLNGELTQSQSLVLAPGQDQKLNFTLVSDKPGTYEVSIGDLQSRFEVVPLPEVVVTEISSYLWIWIVLIIVASVMIALPIRKKKHSS